MQNTPQLDVDSLIVGGRGRRRRRNVARLVGAALAVALVGGTAYGVAQLNPGNNGTGPAIDPTQTTQTPETTQTSEPPRSVILAQDGGQLLDGRYQMWAATDASGALIQAELTLTPGWESGSFPTIAENNDTTMGGVAAYGPSALATGNGCAQPMTSVSGTTRGLAEQLAQLPGSTVVQPVTSAAALGYDGFHLRVRIDVECGAAGPYLVADAPRGGRWVSHVEVPARDVIIDFWVVDVDGTPVVVDEWHTVNASQELVAKTTTARESITLVTQ